MTILEQTNRFADLFGKKIIVNNTTWHYYRIGTGALILWLTGGLRRAAPGFAFMEKLAARRMGGSPSDDDTKRSIPF